jgi:hypothetical protein
MNKRLHLGTFALRDLLAEADGSSRASPSPRYNAERPNGTADGARKAFVVVKKRIRTSIVITKGESGSGFLLQTGVMIARHWSV